MGIGWFELGMTVMESIKLNWNRARALSLLFLPAAYQMVHNRVFYTLEFVVAIVLMSLAFIEKPSVMGYDLGTHVHGTLEVICLMIISVESFMKVRWMSPKVFLRHKRSMFKVSWTMV